MASESQNSHVLGMTDFTSIENPVPAGSTGFRFSDDKSTNAVLNGSGFHPAQHGNDERFNTAAQPTPADAEKLTSAELVLTQKPHSEHAWRPSLLRAGALSGLGALFTALVLVFAAYAILKASDGQPVADWRYQPTVYLALFTAVSNKCLAFAAVQATVVTFWLRALQGTTLGQLHWDWAYGLHAYKAILAGRRFNLIALACMCATFVAMDAPLLQRASSVQSTKLGQKVQLAVSLTPEIPAYYTGWAIYSQAENMSNPNARRSEGEYSEEFIPTMKDYARGIPLDASGVTGCIDSCSATVRAPALAVHHCSTELIYTNYTKPLTKDEEEIVHHGLPPHGRDVFASEWWSFNGTTEYLGFQTRISDKEVAETCAGYLNKTTCYLESAIAEYDILISQGYITFAGPTSYPRLIARANNTGLTSATKAEFNDLCSSYGFLTGCKSTLYGIGSAMYDKFGGMIGLVPYPSNSSSMAILTGGAGQVIDLYANNLEDIARCSNSWRDPRDDIMAAANKLMFRTGLDAAQKHSATYLEDRMDPGLSVVQYVTGSVVGPTNVYKSDFAYFSAAAVVELFTILVILINFRGYWRLGRHMTFSPLEIAKAFDAPLLESASSNISGYRIAKLEGERKVRYGIVPGRRVIGKLVITDSELVQNPGEHSYNFLSDLGHFMSTWLQRSRNTRSQEQVDPNDV